MKNNFLKTLLMAGSMCAVIGLTNTATALTPIVTHTTPGTIDPALLGITEATSLGITGTGPTYDIFEFDANAMPVKDASGTAKMKTITDKTTIDFINHALARTKQHSDEYDTAQTNINTAFTDLKRLEGEYKTKLTALSLEMNPASGTTTMSEADFLHARAVLDEYQPMFGEALQFIRAHEREFPATKPKLTKRSTATTDDFVTTAKNFIDAYRVMKKAYEAYAGIKATYTEELIKLRVLGAVISIPTLAKPLVGHVLSETIRDNNTINHEIALRRTLLMTGIWFSGSLPFAESDKDYDFELYDADIKGKSDNMHYTIGYDRIHDEKIRYGAYFSFAGNNVNGSDHLLNQNKSSYNFGVYGLYKLNNDFYIADKFGFSHAKYKNKLTRLVYHSKVGYHSKSNFDFDGFNNNLSLVYIASEHITAEAYWNMVHTNSTKYNETESAAGTSLYQIKVNLDSDMYNAIGGRMSYVYEKSLSDTTELYPYAQSFVELALSGSKLNGKYTPATLSNPIKTEFSDVDKVSYGLTTGVIYQPEMFDYFKINVAYELTHTSNTAHAINITGNWEL